MLELDDKCVKLDIKRKQNEGTNVQMQDAVVTLNQVTI